MIEEKNLSKPVTRSWKVYGMDGHRNKISFGKSFAYDFSKGENVRRIECDCSDKTGTNDYVIVKITRNTAEECKNELEGQLSDGIFENCRTGKVEEIPSDIKEKKQEVKRPSVIGQIKEIKAVQNNNSHTHQQPTNTKGINELC